MNLLSALFVSFFKIGLFTFGGGYAMLPLLQAELVQKKKWISEDELMDYFSIGQCTPGIIAVNVATFCGYKMRQKTGACVATAGIVLPSLIIITLLAAILQEFMHNSYVQHAFAGIRIVVAALIVQTLVSFWKKGIKDRFGILVFVLSCLFLWGTAVSPVSLVLGAICLGIFMQRWQKK